MMEVVEVRAGRDLALHNRALEPVMATRWGQRSMLRVEEEVDRMTRNEHVRDDHRKVEQVFNRMHRKSRPRAWVGVLVVEVVDALVERLPVRKPMDRIEVKFAPEWR